MSTSSKPRFFSSKSTPDAKTSRKKPQNLSKSAKNETGKRASTTNAPKITETVEQEPTKPQRISDQRRVANVRHLTSRDESKGSQERRGSQNEKKKTGYQKKSNPIYPQPKAPSRAQVSELK